MGKIPVAVLGATGMVGQKLVHLLRDHPSFELREVVASERSAARPYREAVNWKQEDFIPPGARDLIVKSTEERLESRILFSGLDASVAGAVEEAYARAGHVVVSNSRNHRMDPDVPLVIPEINHDHLALAASQPYKGAIITNSNCSTMFLAMALGPIHRELGIEAVHVTTMQAVTGAGYPGVSSVDILGNVVPYIGGEEEKMESEPLKILGRLDGGRVVPADFTISAQCNRVAVFDGHTEAVSLKLRTRARAEHVASLLAGFRGWPQEVGLPSAPERPIIVFDENDRPQPARDVWKERGMATCVGRIRPCPVFDIKMVVMGHNTIRGAAGAAILNAEAYLAKGYLDR